MNNKKLLVIATPIGNLDEITIRAKNALEENENFFCEDTRVFKKLLSALEIKNLNKKIFTLNSINENKAVENFDFKDDVYCLVSDAGYPSLSDPGYFLINYFIEKKWDIEIINGPSSIMHSLIVSGFKTQNTLFYGFLKHNDLQAKKELINLKSEMKTLIIFESVHRIKRTLMYIKDIFGDDINVCVCRELTKMNETIYRGRIIDIYNSIIEKGEFVILIDNNNSNNKNVNNLSDYIHELKSLIGKGEKEKVACKMISYKYNLKSKELYDFWQEHKNNV